MRLDHFPTTLRARATVRTCLTSFSHGTDPTLPCMRFVWAGFSPSIRRTLLTSPQQVLFSHIIEVVNTFPQGATRAKYAQAAMSWRHPYWDWAAPPPDGESVYPTSLTAVTVNVTLPNGTATIANPLLTFEFHPVSVSDFFYNPVTKHWKTLRDSADLHCTVRYMARD